MKAIFPIRFRFRITAIKYVLILFAFSIFTSFNRPEKENVEIKPSLFEIIDPKISGINFENKIDDSGEYNLYNFTNVYNGGGVCAGDINNDGLPDIFFTGNQQQSRLYLNLGNFRFKDITESSGISTLGDWTTGCTMADVNGDGLLDIYVCKGGFKNSKASRNLLFINHGNSTFKQEAEKYNLASDATSVQATFFDYDLDGDLDMYLVNHPNNFDLTMDFYYYTETNETDTRNSDRLYENEGGVFKDVTEQSGIGLDRAFGLGASVADINKDGYPDIYVANDFLWPDYLFINNGDKTFTESSKKYFKKTSFASMGSDFGDINNDGRLDLMVADDRSPDHYRRNTSDVIFALTTFELMKKFLPLQQYFGNVLQVQGADGTFDELGYFANVSTTSWSWSPLLTDFDCDGWKDLYISNGIKKDINRQDYSNLFLGGGDIFDFKHKRNAKELLDSMPQMRLYNYVFKNLQGRFADKTEEWGLHQQVNRSGAATADFDNDGYEDLVMNSQDTVSFIYRNRGKTAEGNNYLKIDFAGKKANKFGIGAKAWIYADSMFQYGELSNARGFQSASEPKLHFGLGKNQTLDSVKVEWPGGKVQILKSVQANQTLHCREEDAKDTLQRVEPKTFFKPSTLGEAPVFVHKEKDFVDFRRDRTLRYKLSRLGPALEKGDVNNDGLDDFYVGGATGQPSALYIQKPDGNFSQSIPKDFIKDSLSENIGATFADMDGDGDLDLFVISGSNEFSANSPLQRCQLYWNNGKGTGYFYRDSFYLHADYGRFPSCVAKGDFNKDGRVDLFVGARLVPHSYGNPPCNSLFVGEAYVAPATANFGCSGLMEEIVKYAPGLDSLGMITKAVWADIDGDSFNDLVMVGDYMPLTIFKNMQGKELKNITAQTGVSDETGWWKSLAPIDIDNDGDMDFIAGNWGYNTILRASQKEPLRLYVNDFDGDGNIDPILFHYLKGVSFPFLSREMLCKQMPTYFNKFPTNESYARATLNDFFTKEQLAKTRILEANNMASCLFINEGNGKFDMRPLPIDAQKSCVNTILVHDFNNDGYADALLGGNRMGHYKSGFMGGIRGLLMLNDGKGNLVPVPEEKTGLHFTNAVRSMILVDCGNKGTKLVVGVNDRPIEVYSFDAECKY